MQNPQTLKLYNKTMLSVKLAYQVTCFFSYLTLIPGLQLPFRGSCSIMLLFINCLWMRLLGVGVKLSHLWERAGLLALFGDVY